MCLMYYAINEDGQQWRIQNFLGGANSRVEYANLLFCKLFAKNLKWKNLDGEGGQRPWLPFGSATGQFAFRTRTKQSETLWQSWTQRERICCFLDWICTAISWKLKTWYILVTETMAMEDFWDWSNWKIIMGMLGWMIFLYFFVILWLFFYCSPIGQGVGKPITFSKTFQPNTPYDKCDCCSWIKPRLLLFPSICIFHIPSNDSDRKCWFYNSDRS